ncbi:hypothetical protein [Photorhabdus luminescens]|uniref:hypothetical protein n=1 Tax=Photorhabdus luminescens TaxID=29488 RepID=UPI002240A63C|nr:hypothetical protein [Photorhabdus luminescens]MCW7762050.1 hypothetical protein [Photorhabdus luminescens subsp. venezuelensis]
MVQRVIDHIAAVFSSLRGSQKYSIGTALYQTHGENQTTIFVMFSDKAWHGHDGYQSNAPISLPIKDGQIADVSDRIYP